MEATALSIGKSVLSGVLGYAKSAVAEEVALQLGVTRDQAFIKDELEMMLSFLMAAHDEGGDKRHRVNETWVRQVRVVAYDVEDSLMDFAVRVQKKSWWRWRTLSDKRHVAKQMMDLRAKVEDVSQRNLRYRPIMMGYATSSTAATAGGADTTAAAAMFGINEARYAAARQKQSRLDLAQLISKEGEDLGVVAVWGTSGNVGHTSIIWEAYESSDIQKNFPCRAWVRVMHPFKPREFIGSLLEEFRAAAGLDFLLETEKSGQALVQEFNGYFNDKRCLIVLNGLSTIEEWNQVRKCFPINKNGSRIVVSTTDVEVASLCVGQNSDVSELKQLSADQTIYGFYKEPIAKPPGQLFTMPDYVGRTGDKDGNTFTKNQSWWRTLLDRRHVAKHLKDLGANVENVSQRYRPIVDLTQLINEEGEDLGVISVWGTAGNVGHTSIIWEAYENPATQRGFPYRAWVKVAHPFSPKDFIRTLSEEAAGVDFVMETQKTGQALVEEFHGYVHDKRCLIVLDGLCTVQEWNQVKKYLPINKNGNRIIVSTMDAEVANLCVGQNSVVSKLKQFSADQTIYAFYEESSQDKTYSAQSMPSSTLLTSEIQEYQSEDGDRMIQDGHTSACMSAGAVEESQLLGRQREKQIIANLILTHSNEHLEVIAVWGMGGIGKTTLVTYIYQRQELNERFTKRDFVTILRPLKLQELLSSIAKQLNANSSGKKGAMDFTGDNKNVYATMSIERLTEALDALSEDRKCLIVVDDLLYTTEWDTIIEAFHKILKARWTIVITTRQEDIAKHCCKKPECRHRLSILEAKEARELFVKKVFKNDIDLNKEYPELVEPAESILRKCDGLPLAIVTIGGFLAEQETKSAVEWRKLNEHINAELEMNPKIGQIRAVLMKSYDGLPYYLKPCFLYMSIFPEDCNISRSRLVRRWAVEGYSAEAWEKSCMEIAEGYFEELIERSMILPAHESIFSRRKVNYCKLHDLIRDISISMSMKENLVFRLEEGCSSSTQSIVRHLAISSNWKGDEGEFQRIAELSRIRSLTVFGEWKPFYISDKMRFLRVLDLENTEGLANHCLEHIGKLLHLRYLSLRGCGHIFCLPDSVGELSQLEVLDIKWTRIKVLPKTVVRLRKLRYLHAGEDSTSGLEPSCCEKCMGLLRVQFRACVGQFPDMNRWSGADISGRSRRDRCAIACCAALPPIMMGMRFFEYEGGVMVPRGMRKVKSLHTLRYVHLAWGNDVVEGIKDLTGLRKLGVAGGISKRNGQKLCSAISKLTLLESLALCSGDLDLSQYLNGMEPPPENLQRLKLQGEMAKLPEEWINGLQNLVKLTLKETGLSRDGAAVLMRDIGRLPNLSILCLEERNKPIAIGELQFKSDIFMRLKILELTYWSMSVKIDRVMFDDGAMPGLEVLHVRLGQKAVSFSGLEYLGSLKEAWVRVWNGFGDASKELISQEMRGQLEKIKKEHVLKVEYW